MDTVQLRTLRFLGTLSVYALLALAAFWVLWQVRSILPPFFVAFVMAIALAPVVDRLETRGWPRWLATASVYAGLFAALGRSCSCSSPWSPARSDRSSPTCARSSTWASPAISPRP